MKAIAAACFALMLINSVLASVAALRDGAKVAEMREQLEQVQKQRDTEYWHRQIAEERQRCSERMAGARCECTGSAAGIDINSFTVSGTVLPRYDGNLTLGSAVTP